MYIHQHTCISPQSIHTGTLFEEINPSVDGRMLAIEPVLEGVPPAMLRRMSKAVRMSIGAGLPLLQQTATDGIIIGTANGGMEDCIKFLNQLIEYNEGLLTPAHFVQSTPNAIAGQLSLLTKNRGYNATHVHNGLAFENALLDAKMLTKEKPDASFLVGGVDEISSYNYNIDCLAGWYDKTKSSIDMYQINTPATVAGEGAAMFIVNSKATNAVACINGLEVFHSAEPNTVVERFQHFLNEFAPNLYNTIFLCGENGDSRQLPLYLRCQQVLSKDVSIARFKHISGEYPTATSFALWLACYALQQQCLPAHVYKTKTDIAKIDRVIIYNQYQGYQHSFLIVSK